MLIENLLPHFTQTIEKKTMLTLQAKTIKVLVLGSSHGAYALDTNLIANAFNLCTPSQDLSYSCKLLNYVMNLDCDLHHIILFYSLFSPGFITSKSVSESNWTVALDKTFGFQPVYNDYKLIELSNLISDKVQDLSIIGNVAGYPPSTVYWFPQEYGAERRANDHLKFSVDNINYIHLKNLIDIALKSQAKLSIVIPPAREDYRFYTGNSVRFLFKHLFNTLDEMPKNLRPNVINLYSTESITRRMFGDFDHLIPQGQGSLILTQIVAEEINQNRQQS